MNATEHIVECYFRYCEGCFTISDVEIELGVNRQADLFAYNLKTRKQYHIESSITHEKSWAFSKEYLCDLFDKKFLGVPPKREGKKSDWAKKKHYFDNIKKTYLKVGFDPETVERIFVVWAVKDEEGLDDFLEDYSKKNKIKVSILKFRDQIIPDLMKEISTRHYGDEILRTLSLLRQYEKQTMPKG